MNHRLTFLFLCLLALAACSADASSGSYAPGEVGARRAMLRVCADGPTVRGIDVSHWQGTIDWDAVAADGINFAIIRTSDGDFLDREFIRNWAEAKRVGIKRGVYQFFRASDDPIADADLLLSRMGPLEPGDIAPVLDAETMDGQSASVVQTKMRAWLEHIAAATGATPIIYTGSGFWNGSLGSPDFTAYPLWVANYTSLCPSMPSPWTHWDMWQNSSTGSVAGISGNVDTDFFNGDAAALAAYGFAGGAVCGDGSCDASEDRASCPADCGPAIVCGDGTCDASEDRASCPADCGPAIVCGDGSCDASEDATSCPADCAVTCDGIPAIGRTVDEAEGCFERSGTTSAWHAATSGEGGSLLWTPTHDGSADAMGTFRLQFDSSGLYRLEVNTPAAYATSTMAAYVVHHAGVSETIVLDQSAVDGWQSLGEFLFAGGADQWVALNDATGETPDLGLAVVHDALRITRVGLPGSMDGGGLDTDAGLDGGASVAVASSGCGCAIQSSAPTPRSATWIGLLALVLRRLRRRR